MNFSLLASISCVLALTAHALPQNQQNGQEQQQQGAGGGQVLKNFKSLTVTENFPVSSCDMPANFLGDEPIVALGETEIGGGSFKSPKCGSKVRVKGRDGEVIATVAQRCGNRCAPGKNTIGISQKAAKMIFNGEPEQDGTFPVLELEFIGGNGPTAEQPEGKNSTGGSTGGQVFKDYKSLTVTENFPVSSCDMPANFLGDEPIVALGETEIGGGSFKSPKCGSKVRVKGRDGEVIATVAQRCGNRCAPGKNTIGISQKAAKMIFNGEPGQDGTFPVLEWEFVK
jgi:DNA-directed RNA polymerase subunit RPC12/RpoP